jgi:adenylate cyclase
MANPPKIDPKIDPQAWQDYQDGLERYRLFTKTDNEEARKRFESAIRRQSEAFRRQPDRWQADFPRAYALLSATHRQDWILAWSGVGEAALRASQKLAEDKANDAVRLASGPPPQPSLPQAYLQRGFVHLYARRLSDAAADAEKVIDLSPDSADGYALAAHVLIYQGKPEDALRKMQLKPTAAQDPKYPYNYYYYQGHAYYVWGFLTENGQLRIERFKEAKEYLEKALSKGDKGPNFRPARSYLVATLSELGQQREAVDEMIKVRSTGGRPDALQDPQELEKFIKRTLHYDNPKITERLIKLWQEAEKGAAARTGTRP